MMRNAKRWLVWTMVMAMGAASARGEGSGVLRAYPSSMPGDIGFDVVVKSQPFPLMKYVVNVFGAKAHPEEFHLTSSGQLMVPYAADGKGLCVAAVVGVRSDEGKGGPVVLALPPADGVTSRLVDGYMPGVENEWTVGDLQIRQLAFATCGGKFESITGWEPLVSMVRYTLTNKASAPREVWLGLQFGEAYEKLSCKAIPGPYRRKLAFKAPFVRQEDGVCIAWLPKQAGKASLAFKPTSGEKPAADENRLSMKQTLGPGESAVVEVAVPYFALSEQAVGQLAAMTFDDELGKFRKYWSRELNRGAEFIVPEKRFRDGYRACAASNFILTDRDPANGTLMPHPDALVYEAVWAGDGSVSMQATDRMGYHEEAERMLEYFLARQGKDKPEGDVKSAEGYLSGDVGMKWMNQNGFVLWALAEHYKLTRDDAWLRRVAPQMVKACDWIARERARTKLVEKGQKVKQYGLLPQGRPSDLYIWDNWFWTDTYCYMGLRETAEALAAGGMKDQAARLGAEADDYKGCILASVDRSINRAVTPPFVSPTPKLAGPPSVKFFDDSWYSISSPIYMVEARLLDPKDRRVDEIEYWLEKYGLTSGVPAFMSNSIDPYYGYNLSLAQLLRGEHSKFVWTLYSLSAYAMGQGTYATIEGQNIVTGTNGDAWTINRQPHMHSNSRFIDMLRIALLLEEGHTLHLMAGAPRSWLADGQKIEVRRAPSCFGEVNFVARSKLAEGTVAVSIEPTKWSEKGTGPICLDGPSGAAHQLDQSPFPPNVVLHVRPPVRYGKIKSVTVNGEAWKEHDAESVRLPQLKKKAEVICAF